MLAVGWFTGVCVYAAPVYCLYFNNSPRTPILVVKTANNINGFHPTQLRRKFAKIHRVFTANDDGHGNYHLNAQYDGILTDSCSRVIDLLTAIWKVAEPQRINWSKENDAACCLLML